MTSKLTDLLHGLTADQLREWWTDYGLVVTIAGLALALALLAVSYAVAQRRGREVPWLANLANGMALAISAEGMLMFAIQVLDLPWPLAALVFAFVEVILVSQAKAAKKRLALAVAARTQEMFPGAADKEVQRHLTAAARHITAVWVIALGAGFVVALNSGSPVEVPFRLAMPPLAAFLWWTSLESDGRRRRGTWQWTPRQLLIRWGAITPEDQDVAEVHREHAIRTMVRLALLLEQQPESRWNARRERRLGRVAQVASRDMIGEAAERVANALEIRATLTARQASGAEASGRDNGHAAAADLEVNPLPLYPPVKLPDKKGQAATAPTATLARPKSAASPDELRPRAGNVSAAERELPAGRRPASPADTVDGEAPSKEVRLAKIKELYEQNPQLTKEELAETIGVSKRTIYRDLDRLGNG